MRKQQRTIGSKQDRIMMTCSRETGERIRKLADKKGVTISRFVAEIVESSLDKIEAFLENS